MKKHISIDERGIMEETQSQAEETFVESVCETVEDSGNYTDDLQELNDDVSLAEESVDPDMGLSETEAFAYEIVRRAATLKGVKIDRAAFLRTELIKHCPSSMVDAAVETTTQQAGVPMQVMDTVANAAIDLETAKVSGLSALAGIPGGLAMFGTVPADLVNYFAHVLRIEQKLAYIYGWPSFLGENDEIDDETMYKLILFLGVIMQVGGINVSLTNFAMRTAAVGVAKTIEKQALTKTFWYPILKKVMAVIGVKVTKKSFANVVAKGVPILGGAISGGLTYATYKPGAQDLKNHLRLLPQATGGVMEEGELEAMLDAEDERERKEFSELIDGAMKGASDFAGSASEAASTVADSFGKSLGGFASMFRKQKGTTPKPTPTVKSAVDTRNNSSYGSQVSASTARNAPSVAEELRMLKSLLDDGIISQEDFDAKKSQLLGL